MILWHPTAIANKLPDAGAFLPGVFRGVLHKTEGTSIAGAVGAYKANNSAPHFTIDLEKRDLQQHVALNRAARALKNLPGGVQTNMLPCTQIEVVGYSKYGLDADPFLKELLVWIEAQTGIKPVYPANTVRFAPGVWVDYDGWCGHTHVPENDHWDPGAVDQELFDRNAPLHPAVITSAKESKEDLVSKRTIEYTTPSGAQTKTSVLPNGDIQNFGTEYYGSVRQMPEEDRRDFSEALALTAINVNSSQAGYTIWNQKGQHLDFTPAYATKLRSLGLL